MILRGLGFLLIASPCFAQPVFEGDGRVFVEPTTPCNGITSRIAKLPPDIPYGTLITGALLANNHAWGANTGFWGLGYDRGGKYIKQSGYPYAQNGTFFPINGLAQLAGPGSSFNQPPNLPDPIVYREGDWFIIDTICSANQPALPMWSLRFRLPYDAVSTMQYAFGPTWVGPMAINGTPIGGDGGAGLGTSVRVLTLPISGNWSKVRLTFLSSSVYGTALQNVGVGIWAGGANTTSTPLEALFTGSPYGGVGGHGFNAAGSPNVFIVSDWVSMTVSSGVSLVVIGDMSTTISSSLAYVDTPYGWYVGSDKVGSPGSYYKPASQSYNIASPSGFISAPKATYSLYSVEVQ